MNFRTTFRIDPSPDNITYADKVLFIGSCFATSIGNQMEKGKMEVMINPAGTIYNPVSASNTLDIITSGKEFQQDDLFFHDGMWLSFLHYTDFSSENPARTLEKINTRLKAASLFLSSSRFLFITLGTARVYKWKRSGSIVSNCHKIPSSNFTAELLSVNEIVDLWTKQLDRLHTLLPSLKVIFTISPIRHLKDGAHGNQISKSVLLLSVEELLKHPSGPGYFPAYELVMDDLRDYRFYENDMIHLSSMAINYIWDHFTECYFDKYTAGLWNEAVKITSACGHRFNTDNISGRKSFAAKMLEKISEFERKVPSVNFSGEKDYFLQF